MKQNEICGAQGSGMTRQQQENFRRLQEDLVRQHQVVQKLCQHESSVQTSETAFAPSPEAVDHLENGEQEEAVDTYSPAITPQSVKLLKSIERQPSLKEAQESLEKPEVVDKQIGISDVIHHDKPKSPDLEALGATPPLSASGLAGYRPIPVILQNGIDTTAKKEAPKMNGKLTRQPTHGGRTTGGDHEDENEETPPPSYRNTFGITLRPVGANPAATRTFIGNGTAVAERAVPQISVDSGYSCTSATTDKSSPPVVNGTGARAKNTPRPGQVRVVVKSPTTAKPPPPPPLVPPLIAPDELVKQMKVGGRF